MWEGKTRKMRKPVQKITFSALYMTTTKLKKSNPSPPLESTNFNHLARFGWKIFEKRFFF